MWIKWLVFLHVLGAITFFLGHGAAAAMAFQLRKEHHLERIQAMLDLSVTLLGLYFGAFLVMGITGLILPFLLDLWGEGWIWVSIVLMLFVTVWMGLFNEKAYKTLRRLAGQPYMVGNKNFPAEEAASADEIRAHIDGINLRSVVVVGYVIPAFVLWLMIFKPF